MSRTRILFKYSLFFILIMLLFAMLTSCTLPFGLSWDSSPAEEDSSLFPFTTQSSSVSQPTLVLPSQSSSSDSPQSVTTQESPDMSSTATSEATEHILLVANHSGLWAGIEDESELKALINQSSTDQYIEEIAAAPQGGKVAMITSSKKDSPSDLTLKMLSLPSGNIETITSLTSKDTAADPDVWSKTPTNDPNYHTNQAMLRGGSLVWSPDGKKLAFINASEGPTADLYVYNTADKKITRLSDDAYEAFGPNWSPNGEYIAFLEAKKFDSSANPTLAYAWAVHADGSGVMAIQVPYNTPGEELVGWTGNDTCLIASQSSTHEGIRSVNLSTMTATQLIKEEIRGTAISDDGTIAIAGDHLHLIQPGGSNTITTYLVAESVIYDPGIKRFLIYTFERGILSVHSDGTIGSFKSSAPFPAISPDGTHYAYVVTHTLYAKEIGETATIEVHSAASTIYEGSDNVTKAAATWQPGVVPTKQVLFFFGEAASDSSSTISFYIARAPAFEEKALLENIENKGLYMEWVESPSS